ncbi:MAG: hypothetical protein V4546_12460 [Bacteroidota bacterium]|uniref:Uncharacterized protein n=1 Tax=Pedobacter cryotolerans TaxID=2571270 RepID=A0A4U1CB89_9SPHI|nr:hypothetical protein [Pedobacter cryotolerans]TKC01863.1 hypothetical protein FA045_06350 [Pedobacter cryotolerans]
MDKIEEKLDSLEQVLEVLIGRFRNVEIVVGSLAENEPKDYRNEMQSIIGLLERAEQKARWPELASSIAEVGKKLDTSRQKSEVRHHHHLDLRSRSRLWWVMSVFMVVTATVGVATALGIRNHQLHQDAEKFKVVRAFYPKLSNQVEEVYLQHHDAVMVRADSLLRESIAEKKKVKKSGRVKP